MSNGYVLDRIEQWRNSVEYYIDDIESWRNNPLKRAYNNPWPDEPVLDLSLQTRTIIAALMRESLKVDVKPIQDILRHVETWYADQNANRIPDQSELETLKNQAFPIVYALQDMLYERDVAEEKSSGGMAGQQLGEGAGKGTDEVKPITWQVARDTLEGWRDDGMTYESQAKLAKRIHCSASTVAKAFKNSNALQAWLGLHKQDKAALAVGMTEMTMNNAPQSTEPQPIDKMIEDEERERQLARLTKEQAIDDRNEIKLSAR